MKGGGTKGGGSARKRPVFKTPSHASRKVSSSLKFRSFAERGLPETRKKGKGKDPKMLNTQNWAKPAEGKRRWGLPGVPGPWLPASLNARASRDRGKPKKKWGIVNKSKTGLTSTS